MPPMLQSTEGIVRLLVLVGSELAALVAVAITLLLLNRLILGRVARVAPSRILRERFAAARASVRRLVILLAVLLAIAVLGANGTLVVQGHDAAEATRSWFADIPPATWRELGYGALRVLAAAIGAGILSRLVRRWVGALENRINRWDGVQANDEHVHHFCRGLTRAIANALWMAVGVYALSELRVPTGVADVLLAWITVYLIIAVGILVVRAVAVVVATCDAWSAQQAQGRSWQHYYDQLRPLVPLLRRCLEYALWVGVATLSLAQLDPVAPLAEYGPPLMQAIGIFFLGRVAVELGRYLIHSAMMDHEEMSDTERRRRVTITPLIQNVFTYVAWFVVFVLILNSVGFDPLPFLAGAGIVGVVIGLGAQPLINDVVSGFFILFEQLYLVDDTIEVNGARGTVEAIDFRTTRLRDPDGRLHIIRNGDMRSIVNYSKDFTCAAITVNAAYDADLDAVYAALEEAGRRMRERTAQATGDLEIKGIQSFNDSHFTIRAVVQVEPGCHFVVAAALREDIKRVFDERCIRMPQRRQVIAIDSDHLRADATAESAAPGG